MNNPYLIIPIAVLTLTAYFACHLFMRLGVLSLSLHRKIWNVILLITFMVTAVLGLLLAVEVNYKLKWKTVDAILKWHVNFGIAMSFVSVFHLIWHWSYYKKLFKLNIQPEENTGIFDTAIETPSSKLPYLIILSGFTSIITQVLLVREITTVFQGNELYMTWIISLWMLLTGLGVYSGIRRSRKKVPSKITRFFLLLQFYLS